MNLHHRLGVLFSCFWLGLLGVSLGAQPAPKRPQPERWLLIVDTSAAMERRSKAVEGVVGELIASGMNGQMHPADELGIWSFNKQLYAGVMPLQNWQPARSNSIAGRSVQFISQQVYHHKADLEPLLAALRNVLRGSKKLTVVLISDGSGKFTGTPFDQAINEAYARHAATLGKSRMPLVTVLRAYQGVWIGQNVSRAPWPVEFPPYLPEPEIAKPPVVKEEPSKPIQPARPIIMSGSNSKPGSAKFGAVELQHGAEALIASPKPPAPLVTENVPPAVPIVPAQPLPLTVTEPTPTPTVSLVELSKPAEPVEVVAPPLVLRPIEPLAVERIIERPLSATTVSAPALVAGEPMVATALSDTVTIRKWPLVSGIIFMWAAILVALALARRSRRAHATSLITRSLDPHSKSDRP